MNEDGWMRMVDFCRKHNLRQNTMAKRIHDGALERGGLYSCPDGGVGYVHEEKLLAWLAEKASQQ